MFVVFIYSNSNYVLEGCEGRGVNEMLELSQ